LDSFVNFFRSSRIFSILGCIFFLFYLFLFVNRNFRSNSVLVGGQLIVRLLFCCSLGGIVICPSFSSISLSLCLHSFRLNSEFFSTFFSTHFSFLLLFFEISFLLGLLFCHIPESSQSGFLSILKFLCLGFSSSSKSIFFIRL